MPLAKWTDDIPIRSLEEIRKTGLTYEERAELKRRVSVVQRKKELRARRVEVAAEQTRKHYQVFAVWPSEVAKVLSEYDGTSEATSI